MEMLTEDLRFYHVHMAKTAQPHLGTAIVDCGWCFSGCQGKMGCRMDIGRHSWLTGFQSKLER
eukprot:3771356-Prorocentrum_lima.AAC.1